MTPNDFCSIIERIAPKSLALDYDNVGLLICPEKNEIKKVLVALDLTVPVAEEAVSGNYDLVLTHHPIFFDAVKSISPETYETAAAYKLIRHGIGHYAAHTNLDACIGGVNDVLCELFLLSDVRPIPPENLGRIGLLPKPMPFSDFCILCEKILNVKGRFCGDPKRIVRSIGMIGGAGGSDVQAAFDAGCDVLLTGEMKHNQALLSEHLGLNCCVMGHYETEFPVLKPLISRLQNENNDVQYVITHSGRAPLRCL